MNSAEASERAAAPSLPHHCAASSSPPLLSSSAPLHFSPPLPPRMVAAARLFLSRVRPGGGDDLQAKGDGGLNLPVRSSSNPSAASSPPPPPPPPPLPLLPLPPHPSSTATSRPRPRLAVVAMRFAGEPDIHLFAAFDGHGACGAACSGFARDGLPRLLLAAEDDASGGSLLASDLAGAFRAAMVGVNEEMHAAAAVDDSMSGTTAVAALVAGGALHVANVGDSRAVAGVWRDGRVAAEELSWDQTPFRADERARVKACGARVMSVEQVEGVRDPDAEGWLAYEGDPPRVWARDGLYSGTAFTRSLGDLAGSSPTLR